MTTSPTARYAAVTSTLALLVALGGTSYAVGSAGSVGTAQLRNNAVTSVKIKDGAVTGADVKEQSLARVPKAATAYSAEYADRAGTVDGATVQRIATGKSASGGRPAFPVRRDDFTLELTCTGAVPGLVARTTLPGGFISTVVVGDGNPAQGVAREADAENLSFGPGSDFDLLAGGSGDVNQVTFVYANVQGSVVQGTLALDALPTGSEPCRVAGFVVSG